MKGRAWKQDWAEDKIELQCRPNKLSAKLEESSRTQNAIRPAWSQYGSTIAVICRRCRCDGSELSQVLSEKVITVVFFLKLFVIGLIIFS